MLDFLVQSGDINRRDGLLVTWFHRANGKEELNQALASDAMVLEADVTLHGYGTADQKPIPIMAHPPNVTSDITLDQWLDAVLESRKGIKLDFKSLASVGLSLDLLLQKDSSRGIDRPVWLNADILKDPLVPGFIPIVNGTQFLELVQEKFPDVTLSLGWMVLAIYNRAMMEEMYAVVKDLPQKVTFPIKAVHVRSGWPHISWLLSQSSRFSLTLWQSSVHPTVEDLLLVRDNSHPEQVYYDIYEPTLTLFKQAVGLTKEQGRLRRFYPGGDLLDFMSGAHTQSSNQGRSLSVRLVSVSDHTSLSAALRDRAGGMLVLRVGADRRHPGVPVVVPVEVPVVPSSEILTLEEVLKELSLNPRALWGLYLRVGDPELLGASLSSLLQFYTSYQLYRPVWIGMDPQASCSVQEFVSTVNELFPHCTIVLNEAVPAPDLSQRLAVHLSSLHLSELHTALRGLGSYDVILETEQGTTELTQLTEKHRDSFNHNIYVMSKQS
ncbi:hypothetical protein NL108_015508 [Boleophthalmus pectinirostris]|nr:hypothetical protein NL108_015508 [Boleophthalmus pectinirostris]